MAIFDPTIFQGLSGSVGNVTAYKLGDKHVVRGKAIVIKDAKTLVQLKQRERMRVVTALRRSFITVLGSRVLLGFTKSMLELFREG